MPDSDFQQSLLTVRQHVFDCEIGPAIAHLRRLEQQSLSDAPRLQEVAEGYLQCGQHVAAGRCFARAVELQPANPGYLYNLAASKTALGELREAERLYDEVIRLDPEDGGAWLNRSALRRQTAENNHLEPLLQARERLADDAPGQVPLCFALAKELEDLERYDESFGWLQQGAHRRRLTMRYDIASDERTMAAIAKRFDAARLSREEGGCPSDRPIFILGLPRSGTTLVDRIVSAHPRAGSLGEHNLLPYALTRLAGRDLGKGELVLRSTTVDCAEVGRLYVNGIGGFGDESARLIDKTPLNFLYLGLIRLALPRAKIIHLRRQPVDVCYAMYKTLFRAGYPFSYSLQEVGRYYIAYRRLMNHWRNVLPGGFLDVDYERLVTDQAATTRQILDYLELGWDDACLEFHTRGGPAATASAAQVREPIYRSSVGLWRKYERQLAPFAERLREHGIDTESEII